MSDAETNHNGTTGPTAAGEQGTGVFDAETVALCEAIVEDYRKGETRKAEAAAQIYRALRFEEVVEDDDVREREQAYETYFDMLETIDRDRNAAGEHRNQVLPSRTQSSNPPSGEAHHGDEDVAGELVPPRESVAPTAAKRSLLDRLSEPSRSLLERLTEPSPRKRQRDGDDEESDSESATGPSRSKRHIDESLFPFSSSIPDDVRLLSDALQRTLLLKENYTRDLATAKQRVVCSPGCPPVPDAIWSDVLANRYVDLDRVFSAVYAVDGDHKQSIRLGELELSGVPAKPKRHIERHGHWTIAWALYQRAVLYVYPHREPELRAYYDQINGFFAAVSEHEAIRIVNLDRAIRGEVGRSNTLLLSDFSRFNHLYTMHVVGAGASTQSAPISSTSPRRSITRRATTSSEPCIRFNDGRCNSARMCRYHHRQEANPIVANKRPRRFRGFLWDNPNSYITPLATLSESMNPLPSPPYQDLHDEVALSTITSRPDLFQIVSPVKVDVLEHLLHTHPNRPLVESVCRGFREGFWPFADPISDAFPQKWDEPTPFLDDDAQAFALKYAEDEEAAQRYSPSFVGELLPGMYSMPVHTVPKPHSDKLRFINNHSAGSFSLNSMIDKCAVGMRPDNVQDLAHNLLHFRKLSGDAPLHLFKSDIANAYRILPMHPLWQLRQVVTINGVRRVDRCCCFGNRGSPDLFCTVMALVLWIAIHVRNIPALLAYMDDNFSFEPSPTLVPYHGYGAVVLLPAAQVQLLTLWDDLGIPHALPKQLFGESLTITGFLVDSLSMSISLPSQSCDDLVNAIRAFLANAPQRRRTLREWQQMLSWLNWGLNVQPLLRPALQSSYAKIAGMAIANAPIYINARVTRDLLFIAQTFERHGGIYIMKAAAWGPDQADLLVFCDACLSGMAFWIPALSLAFVADCPPAPNGLDDNIFWYEALTVLSALRWIDSEFSPPPARLAIYTDNLNTVQIFDSFRATPSFDELLLCACDTLIASGIDLRVWHIAGHYNSVADTLSRGLFHVALQYAPSLSIATFIPPQPTLGELKR
ncbi:hypothetical protein BN946_scf184913.g3 [Trametes cinnabarina]|uniref:C3H1-type domain-containing protein n=1 Tax=Pycnoporus cinnabarinus TaxID=5643 RepID=A0A060S749_PYCCI|nr:hypothetical protein BN946_scf184913.g3 [Trametes cinnabarina]